MENCKIHPIVYRLGREHFDRLRTPGVGVAEAGARALSMLDLHHPEMDWTRIASGLGVEASRARTAQEFADQYAAAMRTRGPRLIEAMI